MFNWQFSLLHSANVKCFSRIERFNKTKVQTVNKDTFSLPRCEREIRPGDLFGTAALFPRYTDDTRQSWLCMNAFADTNTQIHTEADTFLHRQETPVRSGRSAYHQLKAAVHTAALINCRKRTNKDEQCWREWG